MAKFYGAVGYAISTEISPGVWIDKPVERMYYGDVNRHVRQNQTGTGLNDNLNVSNEVSIIADPFANENFYNMKYVEFMGARWKITSVEVAYPRLKLTVGGVYNESQASTT